MTQQNKHFIRLDFVPVASFWQLLLLQTKDIAKQVRLKIIPSWAFVYYWLKVVGRLLFGLDRVLPKGRRGRGIKHEGSIHTTLSRKINELKEASMTNIKLLSPYLVAHPAEQNLLEEFMQECEKKQYYPRIHFINNLFIIDKCLELSKHKIKCAMQECTAQHVVFCYPVVSKKLHIAEDYHTACKSFAQKLAQSLELNGMQWSLSFFMPSYLEDTMVKNTVIGPNLSAVVSACLQRKIKTLIVMFAQDKLAASSVLAKVVEPNIVGMRLEFTTQEYSEIIHSVEKDNVE